MPGFSQLIRHLIPGTPREHYYLFFPPFCALCFNSPRSLVQLPHALQKFSRLPPAASPASQSSSAALLCLSALAPPARSALFSDGSGSAPPKPSKAFPLVKRSSTICYHERLVYSKKHRDVSFFTPVDTSAARCSSSGFYCFLHTLSVKELFGTQNYFQI